MRRSDGTLAWMQVVESSRGHRPRAPTVGALGDAGAVAEDACSNSFRYKLYFSNNTILVSNYFIL